MLSRHQCCAKYSMPTIHQTFHTARKKKKNITEAQNTKPQPGGTAPDTRQHTSDANIHNMFGLWDLKMKTCLFSIFSSRCCTWSQNAVTVYCGVCSTPNPTHHQHVDHWHRSKVKKAHGGQSDTQTAVRGVLRFFCVFWECGDIISFDGWGSWTDEVTD